MNKTRTARMNADWDTENLHIMADVRQAAESGLPWQRLNGARVLVTGATGLIGSLAVKTMLYRAQRDGSRITVLALARSRDKFHSVFGHLETSLADGSLCPVIHDVRQPLPAGLAPDFIIHAASVTSSAEMLQRPVDTIMTCMAGTRHVLELAQGCGAACVFLSSLETYGRLDHVKAMESDAGYLDVSLPRNSYPLSKRLAENLCVAYHHQYGTRCMCARLTQTFGPGVTWNDGRVFAQFARAVICGQDIILHTPGKTTRDYLYTADAVTGILAILLKGEGGEIYNLSNEDAYVSIYEMAELFAGQGEHTRVVVRENPDEQKKYLGELHISLDNTKLDILHRFARTPLPAMVDSLLNYMREQQPH